MTNINKLIDEIITKINVKKNNIVNGLLILYEQNIDEESKKEMKKIFEDEIKKLNNSIEIFERLRTQFQTNE